MDKKRGPKNSRDGYDLTKDGVKDDKNYDDNEAMDGVDPGSKDPCRMAWDLMWENGGPGVWALDYMHQCNLKGAEWRFGAVPKIMDGINISD